MVVLFTCKNEDLIKNEGTRVLTRSYIDFLEAQKAINSALAEIQTRTRFYACPCYLQG